MADATQGLTERVAIKMTSGRLVCLAMVVGSICLAFQLLILRAPDSPMCTTILNTLVFLAGSLTGSYMTHGTGDRTNGGKGK